MKPKMKCDEEPLKNKNKTDIMYVKQKEITTNTET